MKPLLVYHPMFGETKGGIYAMVTTLGKAMQKSSDGAVLFEVGGWQDRKWQYYAGDKLSLYKKRIRLPIDHNRPLRGFFSWLLEFPVTFWQLRQLIKREQIQIIHLNGLYDHQLALLVLAKYVGIPCVVTLHGSEIIKFTQRSKMQQMINRWLLRRVAGIACVSQQVLQALNSHMPEVSGHCIENGIDVDFIKQSAKIPLPTALAKLPACYCLLVGHVMAVKGHDIAIKAWQQVVQQWPEMHLIIVGKRLVPGEEKFSQQVNKLLDNGGAKGNIHFIGQQSAEAVLPILQGAMALLIPSRSEGLPYVMLEAGALAKPLIAAAISPFINRLHGVAGCHVFIKEDAMDLARVVLEQRADQQKLAASGQELAAVVRRDFSAQRMVSEYQLFYKKAAGGVNAEN